ncbi:hypothetical protein GTL21_002055 [Salmonella enterica]|nr:hypothetical protein [Salmonella enterica]HBM0096115.1 hypothetical protein [Salmonella enterica subsp. enterica serovar Blitta]
MHSDKTTTIALASDWVQITDGSATEVIQFFGVIDVCRNPIQPDLLTPCLRFEATTLTINAPDIAWMRSAYPGITVTAFIW